MGRPKIYTEEQSRERHREASRRYASRNLGYSKEWANLNPQKKKDGDRLWYENNKEKVKKYVKEWGIENKDKVRFYQRKYQAKRLKEDINYRLSRNLRIRINKVLRKNKKQGSAIKDLGCTIAELKTHLELRFIDGMSWSNYGKWEVDHIKPLSKFDLTKREEFLIACHYTNLQPIWREDNIKKSNHEFI
jgi:hypothetical protein